MKNTAFEFTELLRIRLSDILIQEADNDKYMYLYLTDGFWTAFEKSAFRLSRVCGSAMLLPMRLSLTPFPIVTASIKQDELPTALNGLACRKRSVKERIYVIDGKESTAAYNKWHNRETKALRHLSKDVLMQ